MGMEGTMAEMEDKDELHIGGCSAGQGSSTSVSSSSSRSSGRKLVATDYDREFIEYDTVTDVVTTTQSSSARHSSTVQRDKPIYC
jgi:hypothetical protein